MSLFPPRSHDFLSCRDRAESHWNLKSTAITPTPVLCVQSGKDSIIRAGKRNPTASIRTPLSNVNFLVLERRRFPKVAFQHSCVSKAPPGGGAFGQSDRSLSIQYHFRSSSVSLQILRPELQKPPKHERARARV